MSESWLFTRCWQVPSDVDPKAQVMIIHGLGEHCGRYAHVAEYLNAHGYEVHALDYSGHGRSPGKRVFFDSLDQPSQDLAQAINQLDRNSKLFIYAHSMGVLVALRYALDHQDRLAGMILSGSPLNYAERIPGPLFKAVKFLNDVVPALPVAPSLGTDVLSQYPEVVKAYNSDPLVFHGWLPLRIVYYLVAESRALCQQLKSLHLPLLVMHGAEDTLCPMAGSQTLCRGAGGKDRRLMLFGGQRHEIHNEPKQNDVLAHVVDWLDAR